MSEVARVGAHDQGAAQEAFINAIHAEQALYYYQSN